ncbi:DUF4279 domain-containing protein [Streptomyces sp. NPDC088400]|uniref:DUF4279 domain-containing protein n=1 Tax=Streptomyces sp. NPDC088400 TaxID=3365861 RepID=UPI003818243A
MTLVVRKSDLDPDAITERLGLQPSAVRMPGIDRWNPQGETDGQWRFQCDERTTRNFSEQLDVVLRASETCAQVLAMLSAEGCNVSLSIGGFADNDSQISFSAHEMVRISRLGIPLILTPNLNER